MNVLFAEPGEGLGAGGLDAAIADLKSGLGLAGVQVTGINAPGALPAGVDLVHFHGLWHPWHSRLAAECKQKHIPYAVSPHGMLEPWAWRHKWWKKWPYYLARERGYLRKADLIFSTSAMEQTNLRRFLPTSNIIEIPLGLTGTARPAYEEARVALAWQGPVLLYLSRVHPKKGLHLLFEALARCEFPEQTRLVVVGGGDPVYLEKLKNLQSRLGIKLPRIEWKGEIWGEERWRYFQGADLFCLPTYSENFGLAVLEALQVGTRVLTTNTTPWEGFLKEITGGGWVVTPEIASIQAGLQGFFEQAKEVPSQRKKLSEWAWKRFSWDTLIPRVIEAYSALKRA